MSDFWVGPATAPDTYRLVSLLGGGGEGEVWKAVLPLSHDGRRQVAIKIARARPDQQRQWTKFGHLLQSLSHPGLVRVTDVFLGPVMHREGTAATHTISADPDAMSRYVVMDYIEGVNLREWAAEHEDTTASQRLRLLGMVAAALDEMHSGAVTEIPVAHGDVKPSNIVVRPDGAAILVDLGLARLADGGGVAGRSAAYAAPEMRVRGALATAAADRYAFAVTTAQVLAGQAPPAGPDGWLDPIALRQMLATSPITARRHMLVDRIMAMISAPPEARTSPLRPWLDSAIESLSVVTSTGIPVVSAPIPPAHYDVAVKAEPPPTPAHSQTAHATAGGETVEQFGPYRLQTLLGRGGMGEVYRAHDTSRNRTVALKRLPAALVDDPEFTARFREESRLAAQLNEPHIIPIHDFGEIDGRLFIDMRLVEGTDLAHLLTASGALAPARAIHIVRQVASALDAAHAAGLVHRDVKPANVLLRSSHTDTSTATDDDDGNDFAYLVDFGIARAVSNTTPGLTGTGSAIGSIIYMAPERFRGRSDHRVDVYSLGCLLYEMLTGQRPFPATDQAQVMHAHLTQEPPRPNQTNPAVPPTLDAVIATAMAKDPKNRYPSAGTLAAAARTALAVADGATVPDASNAATSHIPTTPWYARDREAPVAPSAPALPAVPVQTMTHHHPQRRHTTVLAATVVVLIAVAAITGYRLLIPNPSAAAASWAGDDSSLVAQEPIRTSGVEPFMPSVGTDAPNIEQPPESHGTYSGGTPGLYGGTMNNAECDRTAMISFLQTNPDKAAAWAQVENITPTDVPAYISQLTPVLLRGDTTVTNHGFRNGQPTTLQSVLQTGSAVLVDTFGVPRARCYCGNPLSPPNPPVNAHYNPPAWPTFNPSSLLRAEPNTTPLPELTLIDVTTKNPFYRPVGSGGDHDHTTTPSAPPTTVLPPSPAPLPPPPIVPSPPYVAPVPPCPGGQHRDTGGICGPDEPPPCPPGSHRYSAGCVPTEQPPCPGGQHRDGTGPCTPNKKTCGAGEELNSDGICKSTNPPHVCPGGGRLPNGDCTGPPKGSTAHCKDGYQNVNGKCFKNGD